MKRFVWTGALMLFAALSLAANPPVASAQDDLTKNLVEYYTLTQNPGNPVKVQSIEAAPLEGFKKGILLGDRGRQVPFVITNDGKYAVFGELVNVSDTAAIRKGFKDTMAKIDLKDRITKGPDNAKVTIVEYSDFQCPYCTRGYNTIENEVLKQYGDKVRFAYKHLPLNFHPAAMPAAIAVECAGAQNEDAYWKLYSFFFENQQRLTQAGADKGKVKELSHEGLKDSKVDVAKFDKCVDGNETQARVQADMAEAASLGIQGTPGFVINGRPLKGAYPFASFKAIIDAELAN
jgi:protein-disulfide isomerase